MCELNSIEFIELSLILVGMPLFYIHLNVCDPTDLNKTNNLYLPCNGSAQEQKIEYNFSCRPV